MREPELANSSSRSATACTARATSPPVTATCRRSSTTTRVLVTPTGFHKGFIKEDELVIVDLHGKLLRGTKQAVVRIPHARARPTPSAPTSARSCTRIRPSPSRSRSPASASRSASSRRPASSSAPSSSRPTRRRRPTRCRACSALHAPVQRDRHGSPRRHHPRPQPRRGLQPPRGDGARRQDHPRRARPRPGGAAAAARGRQAAGAGQQLGIPRAPDPCTLCNACPNGTGGPIATPATTPSWTSSSRSCRGSDAACARRRFVLNLQHALRASRDLLPRLLPALGAIVLPAGCSAPSAIAPADGGANADAATGAGDGGTPDLAGGATPIALGVDAPFGGYRPFPADTPGTRRNDTLALTPCPPLDRPLARRPRNRCCVSTYRALSSRRRHLPPRSRSPAARNGCDPGPWPIPLDAVIEGSDPMNPAGVGDRHVMVPIAIICCSTQVIASRLARRQDRHSSGGSRCVDLGNLIRRRRSAALTPALRAEAVPARTRAPAPRPRQRRRRPRRLRRSGLPGLHALRSTCAATRAAAGEPPASAALRPPARRRLRGHGTIRRRHRRRHASLELHPVALPRCVGDGSSRSLDRPAARAPPRWTSSRRRHRRRHRAAPIGAGNRAEARARRRRALRRQHHRRSASASHGIVVDTDGPSHHAVTQSRAAPTARSRELACSVADRMPRGTLVFDRGHVSAPAKAAITIANVPRCSPSRRRRSPR